MEGLNKKVILAGDGSAGKTSLVKQFVHQKFLEKYPRSIGVRIDRKEVEIGDTPLNMIIWDYSIEGDRKDLPQSFFIQAEGVIYVVDLSRPDSFHRMDNDLSFLKQKLPDAPVIIAANKCDKFSQHEIDAIVEKMPVRPHVICSAKDAINVSAVFEKIGELLLT